MKSSAVRPFPSVRRTALSRALLIALGSLSLPALAADECGPAEPGGQVVCTPTGTDPVPQLHYTGVSDFELVLRDGFQVDGNQLPEGDTAVVVYGEGAIALTAEDGSIIRAHDAWPAVDVVSNSGPVTVRVDQVFGGSVGVAALAAGDVSVWANHVEGGTAIEATSLGGNVVVDVASVLAGGSGGTGVLASTSQGDVAILAGETRVQGDFSTGLWAETEFGSVSIDAGYVGVEGILSRAVQAVSWEGGDVHVAVQTASAAGEGSSAILAGAGAGDAYVTAGWASSMGDYGFGVGVFAFQGNAYLDIGGVGTDGETSRGIDVGAYGEVVLRNDSVFTMGNNSEAINIETAGNVAVEARLVTTYGDNSTGLRVLTGSDVWLDIDEIWTHGENSAAIAAFSDMGDVVARVRSVHTLGTVGDWYAVGLSSTAGDVDLQVDEAIHAASGWAVTLASGLGRAYVLVSEGASVYGGVTAIDSVTALGTRIDIAGSVSSGSGPVITVGGNDAGTGAADIRIGSTGTLEGWLQLSGANDVLANGGLFLGTTANASDFGAGNDVFRNLGQVRLQGDDGTLRFAGLERFENSGIVSLVNDRVGDVFVTDGTLHGAQGGRLVIDVALDGYLADRFEVGALSGTNVLELDLMGGGSLLELDGVQVMSSESGQTGDELVLAANSRNRGFIGLGLDYDGLGNWTLESDLSDGAYLAGAVASGARDVWRQGVQAVQSHLDATQGDADASGAWVQVLGGEFDGTSQFSHASGSRELAWQGSHDGLQAGVETTLGHWRAGVTGGFGQTSMDLGGSEETRLDASNLGLYARYAQKGWFAGAVLRGDRISVESDWASIGLEDEGRGSSVGLQLEGGRRFEISRVWIEPSLRLSWIDVSLPDLQGAGGDVHFEDGATSSGELGLAIGLTDGWRGLRPYASMSIAREFGGGDRTVYDTAFDDITVTEDGDRSFGRFAAGLQWTRGRVDLYGEVDTRVGDIEGSTGRIGARVRF